MADKEHDRSRIVSAQLSFLTPEQQKAIEKAADNHKAAQRELTKALGVLWNAQIDMAVASQSSSLLRAVSARPLSFFDDCNCCSIIIF